jgi:hypothetical protein
MCYNRWSSNIRDTVVQFSLATWRYACLPHRGKGADGVVQAKLRAPSVDESGLADFA